MSKKVLIVLILLSSFTFLNASEESNSSKPIVKSSWGIELNPFRLPYSIVSNGASFSAGINYFNYENNYEISIPFTYNCSTVDRFYYEYGEYTDEKYDYEEVDINLDLHFRKFLTSQVGGVYLGMFGRYTFLEGKLKDDHRFAKVHKFGLGLEVGFRVMGLFRGSPIYWGMSLGSGRYFSKHNGIFDVQGISLYMDDRKYFVDVEVLKFGYEF